MAWPPRPSKARGNQNGKTKKFTTKARKEKRQHEAQEIESLEARIEAEKPECGSNPLAAGNALAKLFSELPLSEKTKRGLTEGGFTRMTTIQRASLPHALCGRDILGAAKTGSGKTLAFLIPVIEKLYRLRWSPVDGVGAIIISPTRELALQIFEVLRKVGKHHTISGGLLIGGRKDVDMEKERVNALNILVCTPGRLLQHMDETPLFDCSQLQVLVLDEADRILDLGFSKSLNAILSQLPRKRQTLLFSATQTQSVQDLARLSLKDPEYIAVHAESTVATPARLQQTAIIVPLSQKLDMLWSFIKSHLNSKILVFLSSCKQVKFVYEAFKKLHPGVPIKCLHGRMKQTQRLLVLYKYTEEQHSVLFATDIASRGLDFPSIDWVVQVDCPEDVPSYIHRVGRTARFTAGGRSVAFLMPSELKMLNQLQAAKIPIKVIKANESKLRSISGPLAGILSKDPDLKYMAQRAFVTYLRSIHLRSDKELFDVSKLPIEDFSVSLGLPTAPRIRFLKRGGKKPEIMGGEPEKEIEEEEGIGNDYGNADDGDEEVLLKVASGNPKIKESHSKLVRDKDADTASVASGNPKIKESHSKLVRDKDADTASVEYDKLMSKNEDKGDNLFLTQNGLVEDGDTKAMSLATRVSKKKKLKISVNKPVGQRVVFDDEGNPMAPLAAFANRQAGGVHENQITVGERYSKLKEEMKHRDKEDKLILKQRLREKRTRDRRKLKRDASSSSESENGVVYNDTKKSRKVYFHSGSSDDETSNDNETKKTANYVNSKTGSLSIAEQESLALKLLGSKQ